MTEAIPNDELSAEMLAALAVCDTAAVYALRHVGKRIVRQPRSRFAELRDRGIALHEAHTVWPIDQATAERALVGTLDALPGLVERYVPGSESKVATARVRGYLLMQLTSGEPHDLETMKLAIGVV